MKWNSKKQCITNDDGSKIVPYKSIVGRFKLPCTSWPDRWGHDEKSSCYAAHMRYKCYLSKELTKVGAV